MPAAAPSRAREVALLGVLVALALPSVAHGARATASEDDCAVAPCVANLSVKAERTERNDLTLRADGAGVVITDAATPLEADRNCVKREDGSVRCELSRPITQVQIETGDSDSIVRVSLPGANLVSAIFGDGDDRFEGEAKEIWANGLGGNDVLVAIGGVASFEGRDGDDVLLGGPASDRELIGGPGRDRVSGGPGDDVLYGDDPDNGDTDVPTRDELDGGEGRDLVSYSQRRFAVAVDLAAGVGGTAAEGDVLRAVENARGGRGNDRLAGDDGPNRLFGDDGADTLYGRGGDDFVSLDSAGETGTERADGGAGDDDVRARYGGTVLGGPGEDLLRGGRLTLTRCGTGADLVRPQPGATVRMGSDCERWGIRATAASGDTALVMARPRIAGDAVRIPLRCPYTDAGCILSMRVTTPAGRTLGRDGARLTAGQRKVLVVRARALLRTRTVRVQLALRRIGYGGGAGAVVVGR